jgi:hypothetical protein
LFARRCGGYFVRIPNSLSGCNPRPNHHWREASVPPRART